MNIIRSNEQGRFRPETPPEKRRQPHLSLLQKGSAVLPDLPLRLCHLSGLLCGKHLGHEQRSDMDLP
jgi:hypothetical protein